jgi:hypothetical protein
MTILQEPPRSGDGHAARAWRWFGHRDQAVRHTEAWEHETFAEEQARWERGDPEYARICEEVRQAREKGGEASRRADEVKAEWDARVASQRQTNDDAQRADHAIRAREGIITLTRRSRSSPMARRRPGSSPSRSASTINPPRCARRAASDRSHDAVFVAQPPETR